MEDADLLISAIEFKVRKLVEQLNNQNSEIDKLNKINQEQNRQIIENNQIIKHLKRENEILKIAKSLEFVEGKKNAKRRLNELVREIDKCIAQLKQ